MAVMAGTQVPSSRTLEPDVKTLTKLWPYLWPRGLTKIKTKVIIAALSLILAKLATLFVPFSLKLIIDSLATVDRSTVLVSIPLALILFYTIIRLLSVLFSELRDAVFAQVTQRAVRQVALTVFHHLHSLGLRYHLERQTGGLTRSIERGVKGIETLLQFLTFNIIPTLVEIILVGALLWWLYDYRFGLISILTIVGYIVFTLLITEWRIRFIRFMNSMDNEANTKAVDSLLNFETVKYFNNELYEEARFDTALKQYEAAAIKSRVSLALLNGGQGLIISLGLALILILGSQEYLSYKLSLGDMVALNTYLIQLYIPLFNLGFAYREVKISLVNMESMFDLLTVPREIKDQPKAPELAIKGGEITFDTVNFHYQPDRAILKGISFKIPAGKTVAIVGASGSGKSTIARLLFRFYDVTEGKITIDGQDIRTVTQRSLRASMGVVPQDTVLFNETIYYNIAYGNPEADPNAVQSAAQLAHIHDFIISLPQGYESYVGERGLKLSGGEKQRIAIARTLLKRPRIFLFDEATSALDTRTEKQIHRNLLELSKNHTTLIIAHRLSTVVDADEILVLDQGEIIERGNHGDLLKQEGVYTRMWQRQQHKNRKIK